MDPRMRKYVLMIATLAVAVVVMLIIRRSPSFAGEWQCTPGAYVPQNPLLGEQISITSGSVIIDGVEHPCDREPYDRDAALTLRDQVAVLRVALDDAAGRLVLGVDFEQAVYERRR